MNNVAKSIKRSNTYKQSIQVIFLPDNKLHGALSSILFFKEFFYQRLIKYDMKN